ncbi:hypothetical protein [Devosia aurantiaca]|uniref:hypothetical protein n=1 Tax=Devosia aurantiaca TaxID=2714858 RepID=UPI001A99D5C4|nr:hypothetical protein [Devosia aurantiaca]
MVTKVNKLYRTHSVTFGADRDDRTLATIRINGADVGDMLISEVLARRWPSGEEFWC